MTTISLLNWMLLSTVLLGAWWLCYHLALRRERGFAYNRAFLVLGPLLAAVLPVLPLAWPAGWGAGPALPGLATVLLPAVRVGTAGSAGPDWAWWLLTTYVLGAGLLLARLAYGLGKLWRGARHLPAEKHTGYRLLRTQGRLPTSSFGKTVFWDETLPLSAAEARQVLTHELAHVRQGHTYDHLLLEVLRAVLWFNPFVHLCGRALALTHEFLADEAALRPEAATVSTATVSRSYTHLLARQVAIRLGFSSSLAHSFSHSQTLSRITMIHQNSPIRRWKQWLALPLFGVLFSTVAGAQQINAVPPATSATKASVEYPPVPPPPPPIMLGQPAPPLPPAVYTKVDQLPELASASASGSKSIVEYVQKHVQYPKAAPDLSVGGTVFASFIVTSKGEVQAVAITLHSAPAYEAAVLAAIAQLPALVPGRNKGKAVDVALTMPVYFVKMAPTVPK